MWFIEISQLQFDIDMVRILIIWFLSIHCSCLFAFEKGTKSIIWNINQINIKKNHTLSFYLGNYNLVNAAMYGYTDAVNFLLEDGADVNEVDWSDG